MELFEQVITKVAHALQGITGIDAVVLGGSHATGHANADSDIDFGVYYGAVNHLDLVALNQVAQSLDDQHRPNLVTPPGGWGPWVNAGGWLTVDGQRVDLILRDTVRVAQVIQECRAGHVQAHYQPGHPHAYINVMYMGELAECRLLWDATNLVRVLKSHAEYYPDELQRAIVEVFGFEAQFSCDLATKAILQNDGYYITAHIIRSISALNQVIFALNRQYCLNEKKAVMRVQACVVHPHAYQDRVQMIIAAVGAQPVFACAELQRIITETTDLTALHF